MQEFGLTLLQELTRVNAILKRLADKSTKKTSTKNFLVLFVAHFALWCAKQVDLQKCFGQGASVLFLAHAPWLWQFSAHVCAFLHKNEEKPHPSGWGFLLLVCALGLCGFFFARCTDRRCLTQKFARGLVDCAITFCSRNGYLLARQRENIFSNSNAISAGLSRSSLFSQWRMMARAPAWQYLNT